MRLILFFILFFCIQVQARVYIDMGEAQVKKSLVALVPFIYTSASMNENGMRYGNEIFRKVEQNLKSSGYFDLIPTGAFIEKPPQIEMEPYPQNPRGFRWDNWRLIQTEFLMFSQYTVLDGKINIQVFMYDVLLKKSVFKKKYEALTSQRNVLAGLICNDIIEHLTKKPGIFLTKVVATRTTTGTKKELFVMDWDGANAQPITFHRSIVVSPLWHPSGFKVAYTAFVYRKSLKSRRATIFMYDFLKRKRKILSNHYGTSLGADFLPSGNELLITLQTKHAGMDIFKYSLRRNRIYPVLTGPRGTINVEPTINNKKVVFSSNRKGKVMLFSMDEKGRNVKQLTFTGSYNSSPSWSPDGRYVAFSGYSGGRFDLFVIDTKNQNKIRRVTSIRRPNGSWANNESPSFSPDGRQVVFVSDRTGKNQVYTIYIDGTGLKRITFDSHNYKTPKWSPLIRRVF